MHAEITWRTYVLPIAGGVLYVIFTLPSVAAIFADWIPNPIYSVLIRALLVLTILYIISVILDTFWWPVCTSNPTTTGSFPALDETSKDA